MNTAAVMMGLVLHLAVPTASQGGWACQDSHQGYPFCDIAQPIQTRVEQLLPLIPVPDKIQNVFAWTNPVGGVPSLGIPPAMWWAEATHGITNFQNVPTTFFPMPSFTSCAFNLTLFREVANLLGREGRALGNILPGGGGNWDYWAPHINLVRDPRWGRAQETPGEDPFLTKTYATQFIRGLQEGDPATTDPKYFQVVATAKHFAGYDFEGIGNSNPNRFSFNAQISDQDLADTYLVPFQAAIQLGRASGVMCSYNAVNGIPSCANEYLLRTTLRDAWGFDGYITGDCLAVEYVGPCPADQQCHRYTNTTSSTIAAVLNAGITMDCGTYFPSNMAQALADGSITEAMLDEAVGHNMRVRFRTGAFDPPILQPYAQWGASDICTNYAQDLSRRVVEQAMVLLKYKPGSNALPLPSTVHTVALIGPNANNPLDAQMCSYYTTPCGNAIYTPLEVAPYFNITPIFVSGCDSAACSSLPGAADAVAAAGKADATVMVMGLSCALCGEGNDRVDIALPGLQSDLIAKTCNSSKGPCILVITSGSSLDLSREMANPNVDAIIFLGYSGPEGGISLWRALTGQASPPAGRLSTTWYTASYTSEVSVMEMGMRPGKSSLPPGTNPGHTHRFYNGSSTLFPFGYGLSYTTFVYSSVSGPSLISLKPSQDFLALSKDHLESEVVAEYTVNVTNTGTISSEDVVLGFLVPPGSGQGGTPLQELFGYQRVFVPAGATVTVHFSLEARQLTFVNQSGTRYALAGEYTIRFGVDVSSSRLSLGKLPSVSTVFTAL